MCVCVCLLKPKPFCICSIHLNHYALIYNSRRKKEIMIENEMKESGEKWGGRELKKGEGKDREVRPEGKEKGRTDSGKQNVWKEVWAG